jgi:predicted MFS family arabinose efflux permease
VSLHATLPRPHPEPDRALPAQTPILPSSTSPEPPHPSARSLRGLDWFVFFVADVQTGFGPFIAVYLTTQKWTQVDIGFVLSIGGIVALLCQMPGGAIVDAARSERLVAGLALAAISLAALAYACWPVFPVVFSAAVLHAAASCVLGPCIVALSLGLVGYGAIGERLGRNARFASIGNGLAAAAMGACGYFFSAQAVFFVTAALLIPTLFALSRIRPREVDPELAHGGPPQQQYPQQQQRQRPADLRGLMRQRPLFILAGCIALFHLANASMLPLMGSVVTTRSGDWATVLIAACIVVPQVVVAVISPWVGHQAQLWGRRWFLLTAFAALALRGVLFAVVTNPQLLVVVQLLDGITAATLGVMVPLMIADLARGTGHFNFAQGIVGTAVGIGASISPTLSGYLSDQFGSPVAFLGLAGIAALGVLAVWALMPETCETSPAQDAGTTPGRP